MVLQEQPVGLPQGIYFNLSNDDYHNDPALSHSGMTALLISWNDYWDRSCHNPNRKEREQSSAMAFGERCHAYLLEGDKFFERFAVKGMKGDPRKHIFLSSMEWSKIKKSVESIRSVPAGDNYFRGGYPEVSIFWRDRETGIMLRAKIDYLRLFGAIDYKRIKDMDNWTIGKAISNQGLDIQNWLYLEAIKAARRMLKGKNANVQGDVDLLWLHAFAQNKDLEFRFFFQRSTAPFIWKIRILLPDELAEGETAAHKAMAEFKKGLKIHGLTEPPCGDGTVEEISSFHIPRRRYD